MFWRYQLVRAVIETLVSKAVLPPIGGDCEPDCQILDLGRGRPNSTGASSAGEPTYILWCKYVCAVPLAFCQLRCLLGCPDGFQGRLRTNCPSKSLFAL